MTLLHDSIIYELHVKGFTAQHPEIPEELRGTYAGLAHPVAIEYLKKLGITAVELMPVHDFVDDKHLLDTGLRNYWGYNTINFFAPEARYSLRRPRRTDRRVQGDGEGAAPRRHRSDSRRGLQPHRRGQSSGPDAQLPRHR